MIENAIARWGTLVLAILLLAGCAEQTAPPAQVGPARRLYVANESSGTISMIDAAALRVVGTVELGTPGTHDLALTRDGKTLYATGLATGMLSVIDTAQGKILTTIFTGRRCHSVALTNDERHIWVVNIGENNVSIVDTKSHRILGTIPVGREPGHIRFNKDGQFAYVTLQEEGAVEVIEVATHRSVTKIPVGQRPHYLLPSPDGRYMWGGATGENFVYVIDTTGNRVVGRMQVGSTPQHLAFAFRGMIGPLAYAAAEKENAVVVVNANPQDLRIIERIAVGQAPSGVTADRTGTRLFVSNQLENTVSVIDTGTGRVIGSIPVGIKPIGMVASF